MIHALHPVLGRGGLRRWQHRHDTGACPDNQDKYQQAGGRYFVHVRTDGDRPCTFSL